MTVGRVPCPRCSAAPGEPCIDTVDQRSPLAPHAERSAAAGELRLPASLALLAPL